MPKKNMKMAHWAPPPTLGISIFLHIGAWETTSTMELSGEKLPMRTSPAAPWQVPRSSPVLAPEV